MFESRGVFGKRYELPPYAVTTGLDSIDNEPAYLPLLLQPIHATPLSRYGSPTCLGYDYDYGPTELLDLLSRPG